MKNELYDIVKELTRIDLILSEDKCSRFSPTHQISEARSYIRYFLSSNKDKQVQAILLDGEKFIRVTNIPLDIPEILITVETEPVVFMENVLEMTEYKTKDVKYRLHSKHPLIYKKMRETE